jgi:hypothetical protein
MTESNLQFLDTYAAFVRQDLGERLKEGLISDCEYDKGLISLSYEYFLHGHIEDGLMVLCEVKDEYFAKTMVEHLEDLEFNKKCLFIFDILDWKGFIPYNTLATQKPGKA